MQFSNELTQVKKKEKKVSSKDVDVVIQHNWDLICSVTVGQTAFVFYWKMCVLLENMNKNGTTENRYW